MATTKVSQLTELTSAADNDLFLVADVSTNQSKKITKANLGISDENFTSALKTKLDGIEANATADQTGAEIKTAYEGEADTNAFTDAEQTKLSSIETGADVTDTENVTAAGALMDSEVTNLAQVKAFSSADYATAAQGTLADSATQPGDNVSTLTNDAGYLTSFTETNDLSTAVTWANVPDANITQSSVTQHQAALSITESQISDFGTYETADATILKDADIGSTVQAYDADTAKLDVTQNYTAPQRSADTVDNDGSFDLSAAQNFTCTPTANFTLTFTNIPDGQSGTIVLINTGGYTVSAASTTKVMGADMLTTITTAGTYVIGYISDGTNVRVYNSAAQQ